MTVTLILIRLGRMLKQLVTIQCRIEPKQITKNYNIGYVLCKGLKWCLSRL